MEKLDVVIFGATGFTGKQTVLEGVKILSNLKWGIAGRSQDKLENVLKYAGAKTDKDLSSVPIIIADINDSDSLLKMAEQAKVIVNCCGPYRFYGEAVVKACISAGAHHVDVSGEPQYMEEMQLKYNDAANEKGVYVISACGFDSIPADMGTVYFEQKFDGSVNSIETYLSTWVDGGRSGGASVHYGTWESAVYGLAHAGELRDIRAKQLNTKLPQSQPKLKDRSVIHKSELLNQWCLPFPGSDRSVVLRSQRLFYEFDNKTPVQIKTYVAFKSLFQIFVITFLGAIFGTLAKFSLGRSLLLRHPKFFSLGFFSHEGPSEETMNNTKFSITFIGKGWPSKDALAETSDKHTDPPKKKLVTRVSGTNPGYGATCVSLLLSATTILSEHSKMPKKGGVFPPGVAYAKTSLIESLSANGFKFEVLSE